MSAHSGDCSQVRHSQNQAVYKILRWWDGKNLSKATGGCGKNSSECRIFLVSEKNTFLLHLENWNEDANVVIFYNRRQKPLLFF